MYLPINIGTQVDMHISRGLDFSRDARKNDPFLARNCEKCEKRYVPNFGQVGTQFDLNLSNYSPELPQLK